MPPVQPVLAKRARAVLLGGKGKYQGQILGLCPRLGRTTQIELSLRLLNLQAPPLNKNEGHSDSCSLKCKWWDAGEKSLHLVRASKIVITKKQGKSTVEKHLPCVMQVIPLAFKLFEWSMVVCKTVVNSALPYSVLL